MLFFDEVFFESGTHSVSYGDAGTFQVKEPFNGLDEYKQLKSHYVDDADKKLQFALYAHPTQSDKKISDKHRSVFILRIF